MQDNGTGQTETGLSLCWTCLDTSLGLLFGEKEPKAGKGNAHALSRLRCCLLRLKWRNASRSSAIKQIEFLSFHTFWADTLFHFEHWYRSCRNSCFWKVFSGEDFFSHGESSAGFASTLNSSSSVDSFSFFSRKLLCDCTMLSGLAGDLQREWLGKRTVGAPTGLACKPWAVVANCVQDWNFRLGLHSALALALV